jgi:hypothetical protein
MQIGTLNNYQFLSVGKSNSRKYTRGLATVARECGKEPFHPEQLGFQVIRDGINRRGIVQERTTLQIATEAKWDLKSG